MSITTKQKYAIDLIERAFEDEKILFKGNDRGTATDFISKFYEEAKIRLATPIVSDNTITEKQRSMIVHIEKYLGFYGVNFTGKTRKEAMEFISKHIDEANNAQNIDDCMLDILYYD